MLRGTPRPFRQAAQSEAYRIVNEGYRRFHSRLANDSDRDVSFCSVTLDAALADSDSVTLTPRCGAKRCRPRVLTASDQVDGEFLFGPGEELLVLAAFEIFSERRLCT